MKKTFFAFALLVSALALTLPGTAVLADDDDDNLEAVGPGDLWQAPPYDFKFGNHMDTHIQLKLKSKHGEPRSLQGFLYIYFTGDVDAASGLPIARHPRGEKHDEICGVSPITCVAGWKIIGRPGAAKFISHSGINGMDHPVWMVNRAEESTAPAAGMVIPQPGYFSHFHWLAAGSTDPRAGDVPAYCDKTSAGGLETEGETAVDKICEGWFLQLKALQRFAFEHGGEIIPIREGADTRSHLNIVTNYQADTVVPITQTRD